MTSVVVLGAAGFVGSAFMRHLSRVPGIHLRPVVRKDYEVERGLPADIVIDCSGNSRKYLADAEPVDEFELSVGRRLRTLQDFPARLHVHVSSVDVYSELASVENTREDAAIDPARTSHYGFHKLLAEQLVRHYAGGWLIARLAGMVGPGLKKNPVFDVLHRRPLRIHPESRYQFLHTDDVADIVWNLVTQEDKRQQVFNVCGRGAVTPREIGAIVGHELDLSELAAEAQPRIVDVNVEKIERVRPMPESLFTVHRFVQDWLHASGA